MNYHALHFRLASACLFLFSITSPATAQSADAFENFIKAPADSVRAHFGKPNATAYHPGNDAEIWIYYHGQSVSDKAPNVSIASPRSPAEQVLQLGLARHSLDLQRAADGYTQFAFWNGLVAAVSTTRTDAEAASFYGRTLAYLERRANWVGSASGARITRLGDNVWTLFRTLPESSVETVLTIGDAEYLRCEKTDAVERARVKAQFGIALDGNQ